MLRATIPAMTVCTSAETSFSSLNKIMTYLRTTTGEIRLNGSILLFNMRSKIVIKPEEVVDMYTNKHPGRVQLL